MAAVRTHTRRGVALALMSAAALVLSAGVSGAHGPAAKHSQEGLQVPLVTSPGVRIVDTVPFETGMISAAFARTGPYFYTSSLDSISVFDTSDPGHPRLTGTVDNLVF